MYALWSRARRPLILAAVATVTVLVPFVAPSGAAGTRPARSNGPRITSNVPVFGPETIVDPQRVAGEPSVAVDQQGTIYVAAPFGFSTSASFVWRSTDGGKTFHLVPGNEPPEGKPTTCAGGGDSGLAVDTANRLYFVDLQGLTDVSNSVSADGGATWSTTCNAANAAGVDRPWIATYGDPQNGGALYQTVDDIGQCTVSCGLGQVGNNIVEITRSQDGTTFLPTPGQQVEVDGIVSGIVTDPGNGDVYLAHTALVDPGTGDLVSGGDANGNANGVVVVRFPGGFNPGPVPTPLLPGETLCQTAPSTCTTDVVYAGPLDGSGNSTINVGVDFAPIAVDGSGNLYAVWTQTPVDPSSGLQDGPSPISLSISTDHGASWSGPIDVSASAPSMQTNLFPWVAAGSKGRIDIVWYGTPTVESCPDQPCGPTATGKWYVMMAQSLNAVTHGAPNPAPTFGVTQVAEISNHYGTVCTFGIACTTDRGLLDFLSVTPGPKGEADVVWADATNQNFSGGTSAALVAFSRQFAGPSLFAKVGQLNGSPPPTGIGHGSPDAYCSANGTTVPASDNLTLQGVRVTRQDAGTYRIKIRVNDLSSLAVDPALGGTDGLWLVRWEIPDPNGAGHSFFAAMESDGGGAPSFFDGETSSIDTTHAKFLTYPPGNTIQGFYKPGPPGRIVLYVPVADVGAGLSSTLYSITGITATQSQPSSSGPIFNVIDQTSPFDATP
ncbi:MAG: hypothetical protein M3Q23_12010 [Actinomycetota bacterium]|nr:hypothetical protein [Actinomycetota bacterium]